MNPLELLAETGGGQIQQIARTFGVDWPHLIAQIISFGIVCALLYRFAYNPVLTLLEARRQRIAEGLANAERIKAELLRTQEQRRQAMIEAGAHAKQLLEEARAAAARLQEQESKKAMEAAEEVLARAAEAAARDRERMFADLKQEVGRMVVQATAAMLKERLTDEDQRRLILQTLAAIGGSGSDRDMAPPAVTHTQHDVSTAALGSGPS